MAKIADNFQGFVKTVTAKEVDVLNSDKGKEFSEWMLKEALKKNPSLTPEEWKDMQKGLMTVLFFMCVKEHPDMYEELAEHVWKELQLDGDGALG